MTSYFFFMNCFNLKKIRQKTAITNPIAIPIFKKITFRLLCFCLLHFQLLWDNMLFHNMLKSILKKTLNISLLFFSYQYLLTQNK
jgi:hypothetical protein